VICLRTRGGLQAVDGSPIPTVELSSQFEELMDPASKLCEEDKSELEAARGILSVMVLLRSLSSFPFPHA
jgi:hypothetical protein